MKFVAISDTHGCHRQLDLPQGDVLLHAGDVCDQGNKSHIDDFLVWISELDFKYKIFLRGNHDIDLDTRKSLLNIEIPEGIVLLDNSGITIEGIDIWGVSFPLKWKDRHCKPIPNNTQILMSHQPPYGILDLTPNSISRGDKKILEQVQLVKPKVHLFGHIHASYGQLQTDDTLYLNASAYKASLQKIINNPFVFEL